jgi:TonB family protein
MKIRTLVRPNLALAPMLLTVLTAFALEAGAQQAATIDGVITDTTLTPILGAEISMPGAPRPVFTDDRGNFHLDNVPAGTILLSVRRMGFAPSSVSVTVAGEAARSEDLHIALTPLATVLTPVVVNSTRVDYTGRLAGYYQRLERRSGGYFITREQIDRENPRTLSQLLLHVPGITPFKGRAGTQGIRMRGRLCTPLVWIDGTPMPAGDVDLDAFAPQTIHGIELYLGSTTAPARFILGRVDNSCGTIVLWSRGPDTDPIRSVSRPGIDLDELVSSMAIYTADQVDTAAQPADVQLRVSYPQALFAAGVSGSVTAEFVVDETGQVEPESFGIVASSNPVFSEAVRAAVVGTVFKPARRKGSAVRQLVQQPFRFISRRG